MSEVALIAIGYNKPKSLLRLLNSLNKAEYGNEEIPLIISIDNSGSDETECAAKQFEWKHGKKIIRTFDERQGLRKHILSCGEYLKTYEAVYVFEDDIIASPYFFLYGKKCIECYGEIDCIEGISLYNPQWNQNANFPFEPLKKEYDTYFMQYAQSWGQIWLRDKWEKFIEWYEDNLDFFEGEKNPNVPQILYTWGKNSWLKYHIAYCALNKKYFVYPYYSFTTAFVENGTHFGTDITRYHASFAAFSQGDLKMAPMDQTAVYYDAFFENMMIASWMDQNYKDIAVDLYGCQPPRTEHRYFLSTQELPFACVREYGLQLHPIELNIYLQIDGTGIYLYDTSKEAPVKNRKLQIVRKWDYFMKDRFMMWNEIVPVCWKKLYNLYRIILKKCKSK